MGPIQASPIIEELLKLRKPQWLITVQGHPLMGGGGREKCPSGVQVLTAAQCLLLQINFLLVLDDCVLCHIGHLYLKK